eukprot:42710-Eustigmatos_ZCMA.PRE.1
MGSLPALRGVARAHASGIPEQHRSGHFGASDARRGCLAVRPLVKGPGVRRGVRGRHGGRCLPRLPREQQEAEGRGAPQRVCRRDAVHAVA